MKTFSRSRLSSADVSQRYWMYCGLDCCITLEVFEELDRQIAASPPAQLVYNFERAMQGPALLMQLRGKAIDHLALDKGLKLLRGEATGLQKKLKDFVAKHQGTAFTYGKGVVPSWQQIMRFLYDEMRVKPERNKQGKISTDKECLKRIGKKYKKWQPFVQLIQLLRDAQKQMERLQTGLSPDGRMRCVNNVGGTETSRWSSNEDCYGDGTNDQNVDRRLRNIYIPDPGKKFINADLEQAESRCIAYLAQDEAYIRAHEEGNVHVQAGYTFWPDFGWSGDLAKDKALMKYSPAWWVPQPEVSKGEEPAFSIYDMSKRGQHGLNYCLTARGLAIWLGCKVVEAEAYYDRYHSQFPGILQYHKQVAGMLEKFGRTITPLGRQRQFYGRPWDRGTIREAVANEPQSMTGDILNIGLYRLYNRFDPWLLEVLGQNYDSVLVQAQTAKIDEACEAIVESLRVEVEVHGKIMIIPVEIAVGNNWRDME